jgi:hypothetical protein
MNSITVTFTIPELMALSGDAVIRILDKAEPSNEFLTACREHECRVDHGQARWVVLNHIRAMLARPH